MTRCDVHLIFPPQWSPFQPFLSSPSLKAYLENKGFNVRQSDWNVEFYEYFVGPGRLAHAVDRLQNYITSLTNRHDDYRNHCHVALGTLKDYRNKWRLAKNLRSADAATNIENFYDSVTAFKRLLSAFSVAEPVVEVGISSLVTGNVMASMQAIDTFCQNDADNPFLPFFRQQVDQITEVPRYFGISVIGTEQVLAAATLGACLKRRFPEIPILVGGSVFSRLVDRTAAISQMFGRYFDVIVRYEGEIPLERILTESKPICEQTPGIAFVENGRIVVTDLAPQLSMESIPTPDFDDLNLSKYFTPAIVLPLLSTRGCYWDKCAFCYHGMIYGDRYRMRRPEALLEDVMTLNRRHNAKHFALNDEAIPPKLFEKLPAVFPKGKFFFTGLYKFEKFFEPHHFGGMYEMGFRSLYIGLESANERVQRHMKKNNTRSVMLSNLRDAHAAGIWNHTFNFFGFPTETHEEAMDTARFLLDNSDIVHSEGTGTFSFEHNAPISKRPADFGITKVVEKTDNVLELYYDYEVSQGMTQEEATQMVKRFTELKRQHNAFKYSGWIPREHLLVLLSQHERDHLRRELERLDAHVREGTKWKQNVSWYALRGVDGEAHYFVVNTQAGKILETNQDAVLLLELLPSDTPIQAVASRFPVLEQVLQN